MRINYQSGKLYLSRTDDEVEYINSKPHSAVEIDINNLQVLHEDVSDAVMRFMRDNRVNEELQKQKSRYNI